MRVGIFGLVGVVALGILAMAFAAHAQPTSKAPRVGVLSLGAYPSATSPRDPNEGFRQGLRELGYVEGRDVHIEWRYAEHQTGRLAYLAAELVRLNVDVIHVGGPETREAARAATTTIPIVAISGADPVAEGWAVSLAKPGGNVTGFTVTYSEIPGKQLQFLKEALPKLSRVALLWDAAMQPLSAPLSALQAAGRSLGVEVQVVEMGSSEDFTAAFEAAARRRVEALIIYESARQFWLRTQLADLAKKYRLPTIGITRPAADAGYLMVYAADLTDLHRRAASYVDKILKGAKAGDLPIQRPTKLNLVVNLKTARALGLTIPSSLRVQADHVIE